jgi:small subunit ribosomal protein S4
MGAVRTMKAGFKMATHTPRKQKLPWSPPASMPKDGKVSRSDRPVRPNNAQRLADFYDIELEQLGRYIKDVRSARVSGEDTLLKILESRLDNILRRLGWVHTIRQARRFVVSGFVLVNSRKIDMPSFQLKPGDCISIRSDGRAFLQSLLDSEFCVPKWLSVDHDHLEAVVLRLPEPDEVPIPDNIDFLKIS